MVVTRLDLITGKETWMKRGKMGEKEERSLTVL
jgi:hypothetical protein